MTFLHGIFVGWVAAWAPGLLLMSYLTWKASVAALESPIFLRCNILSR